MLRPYRSVNLGMCVGRWGKVFERADCFNICLRVFIYLSCFLCSVRTSLYESSCSFIFFRATDLRIFFVLADLCFSSPYIAHLFCPYPYTYESLLSSPYTRGFFCPSPYTYVSFLSSLYCCGLFFLLSLSSFQIISFVSSFDCVVDSFIYGICSIRL